METKGIIGYTFTQSTLGDFDELLNVEMKRRYSDAAFVSQGEYQVSPRARFVVIETPETASGSPSDMFFYRTRSGLQLVFRVVNTTTDGTRSYRLEYAEINNFGTFGTWTTITWPLFTSASPVEANCKFDVVRIPVMNSGSVYTCTSVNLPSAVGRIKRNMTTDIDANTGNRSGANAIGRVLMLFSDAVHNGLYGYVTEYDSVNDEYIVDGMGMIVPHSVNAMYGVYDTLGDCVRLMSPNFEERYYNGWTEDGNMRGLATDSLRTSLSIGAYEYITDSVMFGNSYWTFKGKTMFESKGFPGNPFFYNFTSAYSVSDRDITGMYVYKSRLIIYGIDFIYSMNQQGVIQKLSNSIGVKQNAIYETGDDLYFISNDKKVISINELSNGSLYIRDIVDKFQTYTASFDEKCFIGSDGKNIYFGGSKSGTYQPYIYMIVYSLSQKYWSVYKCPPFKGLSVYSGLAYFTSAFCNGYFVRNDNISVLSEDYPVNNGIYQYSSLVQADFTQRVSFPWEIKDGRKAVYSVELGMENTTYNDVAITLFMTGDDSLASKDKKYISQTQKSSTSSLGTGLTGEELVGGSGQSIDTIFRRKQVQSYSKDICNSFKLVLESVGGTGGFNISYVLVRYNGYPDLNELVTITNKK